MRYHEPASVDEVVGLLGDDPEARCLVGGATLVAMMNAGLISPPALISLRRVEAVQGIVRSADALRIGAMATHRELAAEPRLAGAGRVVRRAAAQIAHPAIRNVGTIGGSICHGDPSTDLPAALTAAAARIAIAGPKACREIDAEDFFVDYLETALAPGEMVISISIPPGPTDALGEYFKLSRVEGDYAIISLAIVLKMSGEVCEHVRLAFGACGVTPLRVPGAEERLLGTRLSSDDVAEAGALLADAADPIDDVRGSPEYRRLLIPRVLARAIESLRAR